jgi:hypothetical protein
VGEMGSNQARDEMVMVITHHGKHTGHQCCAALYNNNRPNVVPHHCEIAQ